MSKIPQCPAAIAVVFAAVSCGPSHASCFEEAAQRYGIEANLLRAIAAQESGFRAGAIVVNLNGSADRGLMGVNSVHLPALLGFGISADMLYDPCTNVMTGAWLLKTKILKYGYTWRAVGAYHSESPDRGASYQWLIYKRWQAGQF